MASVLLLQSNADEDRISDVQGVKNRDDIISERLASKPGLGRGRLTKPAPCDPNDVIMRRELRPKLSKT